MWKLQDDYEESSSDLYVSYWASSWGRKALWSALLLTFYTLQWFVNLKLLPFNRRTASLLKVTVTEDVMTLSNARWFFLVICDDAAREATIIHAKRWFVQVRVRHYSFLSVFILFLTRAPNIISTTAATMQNQQPRAIEAKITNKRVSVANIL